MPKKKLTMKQEAFCKYYMTNGFNATQAAISAGYSENGAKVTGCNLLTNINVKKKLII
jgi:phage terminase small subunit